MLRRHWLKALVAFLLLVQTGLAVETGEAIAQLMRDTYQLDPAEYELEVISNQLKTRMVDPADLSFRPLSQKEPVGIYTIRVRISRGGETVEKGQVQLRIKRFAEVLVVADKINRHEKLCDQQFELRRTDVTSLREQPIISTAEIVGQRSKRNLRMGSILTTGAIEPVPDIDVGGEVTIAFTDDWGTITVPGRAMQAGWKGDRVRVKNLATGKVVLAQVVSGESVEVNP